MKPPPRPALLILACLGLAGCTKYDTYNRPGVWHPDDANLANIAAMASRPSDLIRGQGAGGGDGSLAVHAIARLTQDGGTGGAVPGSTAAKGFATPLGVGGKGGGQ